MTVTRSNALQIAQNQAWLKTRQFLHKIYGNRCGKACDNAFELH